MGFIEALREFRRHRRDRRKSSDIPVNVLRDGASKLFGPNTKWSRYAVLNSLKGMRGDLPDDVVDYAEKQAIEHYSLLDDEKAVREVVDMMVTEDFGEMSLEAREFYVDMYVKTILDR